jgi:Protein of unknown function (DUF2878)
MKTLINAVAFYIGWFACVMAAARGYPMLGPLIVVLLLGLHLLLTADLVREARVIAMVGIGGSLVDTLMMWSGVYSFAGHAEHGFAPCGLPRSG